ncbi:MAG: DUF1788 domain-containing protein [Candidatus Schekmanbacteria bacterium]|nr:DUF1788 domain-containing protein [Candidatus Schekmanbacteria bacterium]
MSSRVDRLMQRYERFVELPWERRLAGAQRVWFVVYDKTDERRIRARNDEFAIATTRAGHGWKLCDLTDSFPRWMAGQDYRESYFEDPESLALLLPELHETVVDQVREALEADAAGPDTVVAVMGISSLFGFTSVSRVVNAVSGCIRGRLRVFFPGEHEDNNYRLLDARDGWNYMAVPITAHDGADR